MDGGTLTRAPVRKRTWTVRDVGDRENAIKEIRKMPLERAYEVSVGPYRRRRTNNQNALMWQWIGIAADHFGYDSTEDLHEDLKEQCGCPVYEYQALDGETRRRRSTSRLDTAAMSAYMDRLYRFLSIEHRLQLPVPEESMAR